jgi:hypothetical protein
MFYEKPSQNGEIAAPIEFNDDSDVTGGTETFAIVEAEEAREKIQILMMSSM